MLHQLELISDAGVPPPKMPRGLIVRDALIENGCRLWLKRAWGPGPCIGWAGLNPSKADGKREDPTMLREIGFSFRWGFGSLVKVNIFPFISSSPAEMRRWLKNPDCPWMIGLNAWHCATELSRCEMVMAAWGNGVERMELEAWLDGIAIEREAEMLATDTGRPIANWHCLGTNADGSPKHTLARGIHRVPDDAKPVPWSLKTYGRSP